MVASSVAWMVVQWAVKLAAVSVASTADEMDAKKAAASVAAMVGVLAKRSVAWTVELTADGSVSKKAEPKGTTRVAA